MLLTSRVGMYDDVCRSIRHVPQNSDELLLFAFPIYTHIKFQRFLRHSSFSEKLASKVNAGGVESESLACAEESRCSQHTQLALSGKDADRSFVILVVTHQNFTTLRAPTNTPRKPLLLHWIVFNPQVPKMALLDDER